MKILLVAILVSISNLYAQDDSIIKLFPGKWKMEVQNAEVFETWTSFYDTTLVGISYSLNDENIDIDELILLRKIENNWEYIAIPDNQNITRSYWLNIHLKNLLLKIRNMTSLRELFMNFIKMGK